ncbi:MAG: branched-chain amino acid ABC transporter permease [Nocardioidaceae bacterium]
MNALKSPATRHVATLVAVVVVLALLPFVLPEARQAVAVRTLTFAIMGVSWNIMSGYAGLFSFGHAAFFGIGAYVDAYLLVTHGISPWIAMLVGGALAAAFGVLTAFASLRYQLAGAYFALATFAFAQMLLLLVSNLDVLKKTKGYNIPIEPNESWGKLQFAENSDNYYWIPLGMLAFALLVNIALVHSRTGQFVMATRDDETAAEALGVPVMRYRLVAVAVSAALMAMAGVFYAQYYLFVNPDNAFGGTVSVQAIVPAVIGGIGTIWGPVIGAVVIGPLSEITASVLRDPPPGLGFLADKSGLDVATYAVLLVVIVLFLPRGVFGSLRARWSR